MHPLRIRHRARHCRGYPLSGTLTRNFAVAYGAHLHRRGETNIEGCSLRMTPGFGETRSFTYVAAVHPSHRGQTPSRAHVRDVPGRLHLLVAQLLQFSRCPAERRGLGTWHLPACRFQNRVKAGQKGAPSRTSRPGSIAGDDELFLAAGIPARSPVMGRLTRSARRSSRWPFDAAAALTSARRLRNAPRALSQHDAPSDGQRAAIGSCASAYQRAPTSGVCLPARPLNMILTLKWLFIILATGHILSSSSYDTFKQPIVVQIVRRHTSSSPCFAALAGRHFCKRFERKVEVTNDRADEWNGCGLMPFMAFATIYP